MATFSEVWHQLPFVTKWCTLTAGLMTAVYHIYPLLVFKLWYLPNAPVWQIWRPVLSSFSTQESGIQALLTLFMFPSGLNQLETQIFRNRGKTAYYLTCVALWFTFWSPKLGMFTWLTGINMAISWTLSQEDPFGQTVLIVLRVPRMYVPILQLVISFMTGGVIGLIQPVLAFTIAHMFMYLTEFVPECGGPPSLREVPKLFKYLDKIEEDAQKNKELGRGKKLGKLGRI